MLPRPTGRYDLVPRLKHRDYLVKATSQNTMLGMACLEYRLRRAAQAVLERFGLFCRFLSRHRRRKRGLLDYGSDVTGSLNTRAENM